MQAIILSRRIFRQRILLPHFFSLYFLDMAHSFPTFWEKAARTCYFKWLAHRFVSSTNFSSSDIKFKHKERLSRSIIINSRITLNASFTHRRERINNTDLTSLSKVFSPVKLVGFYSFEYTHITIYAILLAFFLFSRRRGEKKQFSP